MNLLVAAHGILTRQTTRSWVDQLHVWTARHAPAVKFEPREYWAEPFPIWNVYVLNWFLARGLAAEIAGFAEEFGTELKVHMVAHSNGTDVALQTMKRLARLDIDVETFIAVGSVMESCIQRSGIRDLLEEGSLKRAVAYVSRADLAIKWGRWSIGYGDLGRRGWVVDGDEIPFVVAGANDDRVAYRLSSGELLTRRFDTFGHGDYFTETHREEIFNLFLRDCGISRDVGEVSEGREAESVSARRETSPPSQPSRETQ